LRLGGSLRLLRETHLLNILFHVEYFVSRQDAKIRQDAKGMWRVAVHLFGRLPSLLLFAACAKIL